MVLGDTTRMFFSCYCVFFPVSFNYEYACFNFFNWPLATTNSSSVSTLLLPCIIFRSTLSFGYQTKIALACLLIWWAILLLIIYFLVLGCRVQILKYRRLFPRDDWPVNQGSTLIRGFFSSSSICSCKALFMSLYPKFSQASLPQKIRLIFTSYWLRQPIKRSWRKSIIYIHKATFNIFCNPFIPIFLMYARGKILNKVFLYTTYHLFKMSWGQRWCMKGERFIIKFW